MNTNDGHELRKARDWDAAEFLDTKEKVVAYLNLALEEGDDSLVRAALGDIARSKGMTQLSRETGITRDGLYKAFSPDGNPTFSNVMKVLKALGLRLSVTAN